MAFMCPPSTLEITGKTCNIIETFCIIHYDYIGCLFSGTVEPADQMLHSKLQGILRIQCIHVSSCNTENKREPYAIALMLSAEHIMTTQGACLTE